MFDWIIETYRPGLDYHEAEYNDDDHTDPGCDSEHGRRHIVDISILARFPDQP